MLELYYWEPNGPWLKPLIVLEEKGIACERRWIDVLAFEQYGPAVPAPTIETRLNQEGEGPLLVHDERQLTESFFVSEYLDGAFDGPSLRPAEPIPFNRMLVWARFVNEVFMPGANTLGCRQFLAPALAGKQPPAGAIEKIELGFVRDGWLRAYAGDYPDALVEEARRKLGIGIGRIEAALENGPWLLGEEYSLADIDVFAIARSIPLLASDLVEGKGRFGDWLARMEARPAVQAALATSRSGQPERAFAPGPEHARWG